MFRCSSLLGGSDLSDNQLDLKEMSHELKSLKLWR